MLESNNKSLEKGNIRKYYEKGLKKGKIAKEVFNKNDFLAMLKSEERLPIEFLYEVLRPNNCYTNTQCFLRDEIIEDYWDMVSGLWDGDIDKRYVYIEGFLKNGNLMVHHSWLYDNKTKKYFDITNEEVKKNDIYYIVDELNGEELKKFLLSNHHVNIDEEGCDHVDFETRWFDESGGLFYKWEG